MNPPVAVTRMPPCQSFDLTAQGYLVRRLARIIYLILVSADGVIPVAMELVLLDRETSICCFVTF